MSTAVIDTFFLFAKLAFEARLAAALVVQTVAAIQAIFSAFFGAAVDSFPIRIADACCSLTNSMIIAVVWTADFATVVAHEAWIA